MNQSMHADPMMSSAPMVMSNSSPESPTSTMKPSGGGHMMAKDDPDNPQNWTVIKKVYVSLVATAFAWVVAFGATSYTAGIAGVMKKFDVEMQPAILGMSLFFWGVVFAPIFTPHLSERFGRTYVYLASLPIFALFILGAALSKTFGSLLVCRFFAGFFGGPSLVLIEGTFADVWSADYTVTYYSFLTLASFIGTACGPLIAGFLVAYGGWRWTQYIVLILSVGVYLFGIGMPESYPREVIRRRARRTGIAHNLAPAQSGVTLAEMATLTVLHPLKMIVSEPLVILLSLYVGFVFATIFQFFIAVPAVLNLLYKFTVQDAGKAFISAIIGVVVALVTSTACEVLAKGISARKTHATHTCIEWRMLPAMLGGIGMTVAFFWIGWSAKPTTASIVPIAGTGVFIWGAASVIISSISYLFDAYPPRGTLSALTAAASFRLFLAGLIPLFIIPMILHLTGAWAYSTFGFIAGALIPIPYIIFFFGAKLRAKSSYNPTMSLAEMKTHLGTQDADLEMRSA